ncbi:MAG TPA: C45 family autoproteolytic acyltransferase/hydrolase [bacterium]|nr:C45 family autoproteolytic acyltransferase/hydrolase [bacterium]
MVEADGVKRLGPAWLTEREGIYVLYLEGSDHDMAYQHGALLAGEIAQGEVPFIRDFFKSEIEHSVIGGTPLVDLAEWFMHGLFFDPIARHIPAEFRQGLKGLADGSGLDYDSLPRVMVTADAGQVIEGKVYGGRKAYPGLASYSNMGCTSFVASGPATVNGHVLHGRNLDFPGAGFFDRFPVVAFCRPASGQRYVMITSAGVHCAGVTGMNESGLSVGFHTAITRDVGTDGWPVLILGEKIVREAATIDQAVAILREHPPAAGWIMVVSSSKEGRGVAVEISRHHLAVIPMRDHTLAVANSYRSPELKADEIAVNWSYPINSFHRTRRMNQLLSDNHGRIDPQKGAEFLGDHHDLNTGRERATGDVIGQYSNVSSVVMDTTAMDLWVGQGPAPVCNTRYIGFSFEDGFKGPGKFTELPVLHGAWENDPRLAAYRLFISAEQKSSADDPAGAVADLQQALAIDPDEPVYAQVAGLILLRTGNPDAAAAMFPKALALPQTPHKQSLGHLWLARTYDLENKRDQATEEYRNVIAVTPLDPEIEKAAERGLKTPFKQSQAAKISVDFGSGDSYGY